MSRFKYTKVSFNQTVRNRRKCVQCNSVLASFEEEMDAHTDDGKGPLCEVCFSTYLSNSSYDYRK